MVGARDSGQGLGTSRPAADGAAGERAERRQVSVMFCDLVDSVALSSRLDPEDWQDVISAYQAESDRAIGRYGGSVFNYLGDGLLACFGYPAANEDDAERAVRAGLDLVEGVARLGRGLDRDLGSALELRVGIATGLVVVGETRAAGGPGREALSGEAVNLASRLQAVAGPNGIVVSATTRQLAAGNFEYRDLGPQRLKGFDAPVRLYEVLGECRVSRLEARGGAAAPFLGRDQEIETLLRLWRRAAQGSGQVAVLAGEAGIGKSRVVAELRARVAPSGAGPGGGGPPPLLFQCSPHHANAAFHPVAWQLERLAAMRPGDTRPERIAKLEAALRADAPGVPPEGLLRLGGLVGAAAEDGAAEPAEVAAAWRQETIEAAVGWCVSRATSGDRLIVFEDVQWIDPTTRRLLGRLVREAEHAGVMVVATLRTGAGRDWEGLLAECGLLEEGGRPRPHVAVLPVGELGEAEVERLAAAAAGRPIPGAQLAAILERSEGVPLYVEELAKAVAAGLDLPASGPREEGGGIPNTIRDALMARLDRLGEAKATAQHAAVIGHEFSAALLRSTAGRPHERLDEDIEALIASGVIARDAGTDGRYRFRHALVRDTAYRSLLRRARRAIHLRVAQELAAGAPGAQGDADDLVAQHYSAGGEPLQAVEHWRRAVRKAIARSAHEEALGMLEAALADLRRVQGARRPDLELDLVLAKATALRSLNGYSAPEVEERLAEARELCAATGDAVGRFNVEWALFQCMIVKGDMAAARRLAAGLYWHAERHPDRPLVDAHLASGMAALNGGDLREARRFLELGAAACDPRTDAPHLFTHGQNPGLFCLSYLARTQCFLGLLDTGRATIQRCLDISAARSREPGHVHSHVNALAHAMRVQHLCGDLAEERRLAVETTALARRHRYAYYAVVGECHLGWAVGAGGALVEGIERLSAGIAALARGGSRLGQLGFVLMLAQLLLRAGRARDAAGLLRNGAALRSAGLGVWDAEIERVRGDVLASPAFGDPAGAEAAYRASIAVAERQGAGLLGFKAAACLAGLMDRLGRHEEARAVLAWGLEQMPEPGGLRRTHDTTLRAPGGDGAPAR